MLAPYVTEQIRRAEEMQQETHVAEFMQAAQRIRFAAPSTRRRNESRTVGERHDEFASGHQAACDAPAHHGKQSTKASPAVERM